MQQIGKAPVIDSAFSLGNRCCFVKSSQLDSFDAQELLTNRDATSVLQLSECGEVCFEGTIGKNDEQLCFRWAHWVACRGRLPVKLTELAGQAVNLTAWETKGVTVQHSVPLIATNGHHILHDCKKIQQFLFAAVVAAWRSRLTTSCDVSSRFTWKIGLRHSGLLAARWFHRSMFF
jgi:hypothetical protein